MISPLKAFWSALIIVFVGFGLCAYVSYKTNQKNILEQQPYCMEDGHLHMGEIISKYSEKVDGDKFYYVTIAGKIDGRYHTRDIEVNKWMWVHTYRVGDYWSPSI